MYQPYYCPECGSTFEREKDEHICKDCSMLPIEIKDEILALSEKLAACKNCGEKIGAGDQYCHTCGRRISD